MRVRLRGPALVLLLFALVIGKAYPQGSAGGDWPTYGGDPGGTRYSREVQIQTANVTHLTQAWTFKVPPPAWAADRGFEGGSLEVTPVLRGGTLFLSSAYDGVFAIDATTGKQLWSYDPQLHGIEAYSLIVSRGVALWPQAAETLDATAACATRVFLGTLDARLIALDAATGRPCQDFGDHGSVDLRRDVDGQTIGGFGVTSPPTVVGNVVVVGSIIGDNRRTDVQSGVVRAFDALTGRRLWSFEPLPWRAATQPHVGAGNVWSIISADPALGLVYLPTSSPALDYYGVNRKGDNRDADSVVALEAATGRRVWAFQTVHHDLWDYDVPSEPLLFSAADGTPAVAVTTKTAQVFVLDRRTGKPLVPVEERPVLRSRVPGEQSSPTQPFSQLPALTELRPILETGAGSEFHRSQADLDDCRAKLAGLDDGGVFTPPSERGVLQFPGNLGGVNWGGAAFDPASQTLYANVNRYPAAVYLRPRTGLRELWRSNRVFLLDWPMGVYIGLTILVVCGALRNWRRRRERASLAWYRMVQPGIVALVIACAMPVIFFGTSLLPLPSAITHFGHEMSDQIGSPYFLERFPLEDRSGHPCASPPWGALIALDLKTRSIRFRAPLGTMLPDAHTGALSLGGPIVTAGGLVFDASTQDAHLRAFDANSGAELWSAALPYAGRATPMTYTAHGRQFVVVAAGGHGGLGEPVGGEIVAFALPDTAPSGPANVRLPR